MIKLNENNGIETHENKGVVDAQTNADVDMNCPSISTVCILPASPPQPCPELLTESEAICYLRLTDDPNASRTLRYYRDKGVLRGTQVGRHLLYRRIELERFLESQTDGRGTSKDSLGKTFSMTDFRSTSHRRKTG